MAPRANHEGWLAHSRKPAEFNLIIKHLPYTGCCMFINASHLHDCPMRLALLLPHFIDGKTETELSKALLQWQTEFKPRQPDSGARAPHHFRHLTLPQDTQHEIKVTTVSVRSPHVFTSTQIAARSLPKKTIKPLVNRKITVHRRGSVYFSKWNAK